MNEVVFNPEMLTLAREAAGLTQSALAVRVQVSQSRISKFEDGLAIPSEQDLAALASQLGQGVHFFAAVPPRLSSAVSFFRKTTTLPLKTFKRHNARMLIRAMELERQLGGRSIRRSLDLPHIPVNNVHEAEVAARALRQLWDLPPGPVSRLVRLAEESGCIVDFFDFLQAKIDGLVLGGGTATPFIFLNREYPSDRKRLTLAHELGHLVMHRELRSTVEDEAWAFAAEFLMPAHVISSELYPLSIERLGALKIRWGVSMQAILRRATVLERVSPRYAQYLWMQMGQYGFRTSEPFGDRVPLEDPTPLEKRMKSS